MKIYMYVYIHTLFLSLNISNFLITRFLIEEITVLPIPLDFSFWN